MAHDSDNRWSTDSRLDRQNSVRPDGWSRLPGDSAYDDEVAVRRRPPQRRWVRALALPLAVCIGVGTLAIYLMSTLAQRG